jgi:phage terminase large subunit
MQVLVYLPEAYADLLKPARYKVYFSGRGAGKSWAFATVLIMKAIEKKIRILCTRELQMSISDSVYRLLIDTINRLGLQDYFTIYQDEIRAFNGSSFIFMGLKYNLKAIRSLEGIDYVWCEEADAISNESLDVLIPTIRKKDSEIWFSFNRDRPDDPVYKRFVMNRPDNTIVRKVELWENPFFPSSLRSEIAYDLKNNPDKFIHIWKGEPWQRSDAQVFAGKYSVEPFEEPDSTPYYGLDFGFSSDPSAIIKCYVDDEENILYIANERYGFHIGLTDLPELLNSILPEGYLDWPVRADSSRPDTISYLNDLSYNIIPAKRAQNSVKEGVEKLLSFKKIVIHPRCKRCREEFEAYSYKTDERTGDILPILIDKHNHLIDALRYSLEDLQEGTSYVLDFDAFQGFNPMEYLGL